MRWHGTPPFGHHTRLSWVSNFWGHFKFEDGVQIRAHAETQTHDHVEKSPERIAA